MNAEPHARRAGMSGLPLAYGSARCELDHGEPAEAMRDLAYAIVEERSLVPHSLIAAIRDLSSGFIPDDQMPADLDDFGIDEPARDERS